LGVRGLRWTALAFIVFVVDELFRSNHVQQLEDTAFLEVVGCCTGKHGHGVHAHLEAGSLSDTDAGAFDCEVFVAKFHAVETFDGDVGGGWVDVFAESNTLRKC
jgi:hypothetical protein